MRQVQEGGCMREENDREATTMLRTPRLSDGEKLAILGTVNLEKC